MIAGIDVGAAFHVVYTIKSNTPTPKGKLYKIPAENQDKLVEVLRKDNIQKIILEPTGIWSIPVINRLYKEGFEVYIVHTTRFRAYARSHANNKDDRTDAYLLAMYGYEYFSGYNHFKKLVLFRVNDRYIESRQMWLLWKEREALKKQKNAEENRLREQVYIKDIKIAKKSIKKMIQWALDQEDELIKNRAEHIIKIEKDIKKVEKKMQEVVNSLPETKQMMELLLSIPELGFITAYFITMQVIDIDRFNKRSFRAFIGVGRKREQSGTSKDWSKAAKSHRQFRALLYMAAMRLIAKHVPEWERYYTWQLSKVSVGKKAMWRVVSKLANIIYGVLRNRERYKAKYVKEIVSDQQYEMAKELLRGKRKKKRYKLKNKIKYKEENLPVG